MSTDWSDTNARSVAWNKKMQSARAVAHRDKLISVLAKMGVPIERLNTGWCQPQIVKDRYRVYVALRAGGWTLTEIRDACGLSSHTEVLRVCRVAEQNKVCPSCGRPYPLRRRNRKRRGIE